MTGGPEIVGETDHWALIRKPHGMPSAPLEGGGTGTLVSWFNEARPGHERVEGRKKIEQGLIHRLDTATEGLVLVAKTQSAYDALLESQGEGLIVKTYFAWCEGRGETLPASIASRFRAFGPGRREVRPLFPGMRGYEEGGRDYLTVIDSAFPEDGPVWGVTVTITLGFRHQIRSHLSYLGCPILGDRLYHPEWKNVADDPEKTPLELHATGISFPDPSSGSTVSFSLPQPGRTTR